MSYFTPYKEHYKALIRLGIPIVIGQIGIVVVGLADNMMVGQSGCSFICQQCLQYSHSFRSGFFLWSYSPGRTIFRPS